MDLLNNITLNHIIIYHKESHRLLIISPYSVNYSYCWSNFITLYLKNYTIEEIIPKNHACIKSIHVINLTRGRRLRVQPITMLTIVLSLIFSIFRVPEKFILRNLLLKNRRKARWQYKSDLLRYFGIKTKKFNWVLLACKNVLDRVILSIMIVFCLIFKDHATSAKSFFQPIHHLYQ